MSLLMVIIVVVGRCRQVEELSPRAVYTSDVLLVVVDRLNS